MGNNYKTLHCAIAALVASTATGAVRAQSIDGERGAYLEEVIVSAQKREENERDVPISLVVTSGQDLEKMEIDGLEDLSQRLPNVYVGSGSVSNHVYIRGVGSGANGGFEQSVGTFVDGVYHGRSRYSKSLLVDVERVEVLRGPQSIYFGNNAIGGAFSVTTRRPGDELEGYAKTSYEFEGNESAVEAAVGGALSESVRARVVARYSDLDGYIKNVGTGEDDPDIEDTFVRLWTVWDVNDTWSSSLKIEHGEQDSSAPFPAQLTECPPEPPFSGPAGSCAIALDTGQETKYDFTRSSGPGESGSVEANEYVLNITRDNTDGVGFTGTLAYSEYDFYMSAGTDGVVEEFFSFSSPEDYEQTSLELRWISPVESRVEYILGAYFSESDLFTGANLNLGVLDQVIPAVAPPLAAFLPLGLEAGLEQEESVQSAFGAITYPLTDSLSLTGGLRWMESEKEGRQYATNVTTTNPYGGNGIEIPDVLQPTIALFTAANKHDNTVKFKDSDLIPSVNLRYEQDDDLSYYASYSGGIKAGGFDAAELSGNPELLAFGPESVDAYEIGMKSLWYKSLSLNLAAFRNEYEDLQQSVSQFTSTSAFFSVTNVGGLVSQGVEMDMLWQISNEWRAGINVAWLDAEYEDYDNAGCTARQELVASGACTQDLTGEAPPFAPKYSGSAQVNYSASVSDNLVFSSDLVVSFSDEYDVIADKDPIVTQQPWEKIDLRFALSDSTESWEVALIGKNLTDEKTISFSTDAVASDGSFSRVVERGRTLILQARYNWF